MAYKLEHIVIGTFASFVEKGTLVGEEDNIVGPDFFPSAEDNPEAWNSVGDVIDSAPEKEEEDQSYLRPLVTGGYGKKEEKMVTLDILKLSLANLSEPLWRMIWGAGGPLVNGVVATPYLSQDRFVEGWLNFTGRAQKSNGGNNRFVAALYGQLRMDADPKWSKDPTRPAVRFAILPSLIQSVMPTNINPA